MSRDERPVRRTEVFACTVLLIVACGAVAGFFLFVGMVVHPVFLLLAVHTAIGGFGVGWWMWLDLRRVDRAMERIEDTVILDLEAIARYKPPTTPVRRRRDPRRWLRYFGHDRSKEGVSR